MVHQKCQQRIIWKVISKPKTFVKSSTFPKFMPNASETQKCTDVMKLISDHMNLVRSSANLPHHVGFSSSFGSAQKLVNAWFHSIAPKAHKENFLRSSIRAFNKQICNFFFKILQGSQFGAKLVRIPNIFFLIPRAHFGPRFGKSGTKDPKLATLLKSVAGSAWLAGPWLVAGRPPQPSLIVSLFSSWSSGF